MSREYAGAYTQSKLTKKLQLVTLAKIQAMSWYCHRNTTHQVVLTKLSIHTNAGAITIPA